MAPRVEFFFDLVSPYSYLARGRLGRAHLRGARRRSWIYTIMDVKASMDTIT